MSSVETDKIDILRDLRYAADRTAGSTQVADPNPYVPSYSFSGWQAANPSKPLPAAPVDNEFANIATSVSQIISGLADVRRSDGALRNGAVTIDSLSDEVKVPWTGGAIAAWATPVDYAADIAAQSTAPTTTVYYNGSTYLCIVDHMTTSTFNVANWRIIAAKGSNGSGSGDMIAANNLSDLASIPQARTNLQVLPLGGGTLTGQLVSVDGSVSAPAVRFGSAATGWYRVGIGGAALALSGVRKFAVLDSGALRGATDGTYLWAQLGASSDVQGVLAAADNAAARTALGLGTLAIKSAVATADITDANVTTVKLADNAVTPAKVAAGVPVQFVIASTATMSTNGTTIPFDDTIPQNTEGAEILTASITPKFDTSTLLIEAEFNGAVNTASGNLSLALFQDSTVNALAANGCNIDAIVIKSVRLTYTMPAGTTNSTTFKLRVGHSAGAATVTVNGVNATRRYGGVLLCSLKITEIKG